MIDGVTLAAGDRVLVKDQSAGASNGMYIVGVTPIRAYDMDQDATTSVIGREVVGAVIEVTEGTVNGGTFWRCTNTGTPVLGTTALTFARFGFVDPTTTRGDLIRRNSSGALDRLALGAVNTVLHGSATDPAYSAVVEGDLALTDITTANASTSAHGLLKKLPGGTTTFLRADGSFAAPSGGGGGSAADGYTGAAGSGGAVIPGLRGSPDALPASPNALDQEFDAAHGGTQLGTLDVSNITDFPSHLHLKRACSSEIDGIYWAVPGSYPYTIATHIPLMAPSIAGHWSVGIMLLDSTPTAIREFSFNIASAAGGTYYVSLRRYTNRTTFASAVDAALSVNDMYWGTARDIYLRLLVTSATSVTLSYSPNGAFWTTPASLTAISPTLTPAYFGLLVSDPVSASTVEAAFDWVRVT